MLPEIEAVRFILSANSVIPAKAGIQILACARMTNNNMKLANAPIQYQKGWTEFFKLKFKLTQDVLIPRPETELLVEEIINFVDCESTIDDRSATNDQRLTIADIGTGSGCIAISLAKKLPKHKIIAIDHSSKALEVAKKNAKFHRVENRVMFLENDLLTGVKVMPDIIAANLPYIPTFKLMYLDPLVREFEPKMALDGGSDGLDLYRRLFQQIKDLSPSVQDDNKQKGTPRLIICEIDEDQGQNIKYEAQKYFPNANIEIKKDLAKKDRFIIVGFGQG